MNSPPAKLLVNVDDREARLRLCGLANLKCGPDFKNLVSALHDKGYRRFVIEMSECTLMDSTFLGLLCGLALKLRQSSDRAAGVELLNPTPRVVELIESLGVTSLFTLTLASLPPAAVADMVTHNCGEHTRTELAATSLEAHQTLVAFHPENASKFKDVTGFLAEDLQRLKRGA